MTSMLQSAWQSWPAWLPALAVAMARPFGMLSLFPVINPRLMGGPLPFAALAIMMAMPAVPYAMELHETDAPPAWQLVALLLTETVIGIIVGFMASVPFWAVQIGGELIDSVRGASISTIFNPLAESEASVFGNFFNQFLTVLFFSAGGFEVMLSGLQDTYVSLPPGRALGDPLGAVELIVAQWTTMGQLALRFCLPALGAMVLLDLCLGLISKSVRQLPVFFLSMPLKSLAATAIIAAGLAFATQACERVFASFDTSGLQRWFGHGRED
jgi:type III secretion protein T